MPSLYVHVPFCKQACHYCDFHFSVNRAKQPQMAEALAREVGLRAGYLPERKLETVYFGGGTPSLLTEGQLASLFQAIRDEFALAEGAEITLEANPDDLSEEKLAELAETPVNRLSVGIQSFDEGHLRYLNRAHDARQAETCVQRARAFGFRDLTIDLIYAIPSPTHGLWARDLEKALALGVPHLSAYCLTIEQGTPFGNWLAKGKIEDVSDAFAEEQYGMLVEATRKAGYEHYEVSNFALPGRYSRHNRNYWKKGAYLGVGPGAHSYDGHSRQHNVSSNGAYLAAIEAGRVPAEIEALSKEDHVNEYLMTSLRTQWGCENGFLLQEYGFDLLRERESELAALSKKGWLSVSGASVVTLTEKGMLFADRIASELFLV